MNSLIRLWNILAALAGSLERTKEIVDLANARAEQSLGIDAPAMKILDAPEVTTKRKGKE